MTTKASNKTLLKYDLKKRKLKIKIKYLNKNKGKNKWQKS